MKKETIGRMLCSLFLPICDIFTCLLQFEITYIPDLKNFKEFKDIFDHIFW